MRRRINPHGPRATGSLDGLDYLEFTRRWLPDNSQSAVAATGKNVTGEFRGVHTSANRELGQDLAIIGIHDDQLLRLSTPDKQASLRDVHGHADRRAAGGGGPLIDDLHRLGVYHCDLIFIHEVDEGFALSIGGEKLRLAPKHHLRVGA